MRIYTIILFFLMGWTFQLSAQCPPSSKSGFHVVQPKETLYRISVLYNISINNLCDWNGMSLHQIVPVCQELRITPPAGNSATIPKSYDNTYSDYNTQPIESTSNSNTSPFDEGIYRKQGGKTHVVEKGQTVAGLANLYGYTEARFREFNALGLEEVTPGSTVLSSDCSCDRITYNDPNKFGYEKTTIGGMENYGTSPSPTSYNKPNTDNLTTIPTSYNNSNTDNNSTTATSSGEKASPPGGKAVASYMKSDELDMINEINLMRSNPANYVQYVQEYVQYQRDNNGFPQNQATIDELIQDLRNAPRLSHLKPMDCVYAAATQHGQDLLRKGKMDHVGSDGSWPWDRVLRSCPNLKDGNENLVGGPSTVRESVIILLIDEGIPNRGHRKTLMRPDWEYVACYKMGQVGLMPNCYVQKFGTTKGKNDAPPSSGNTSTTTTPPSSTTKGNPTTIPPANERPAASYMKSVEMDMIDEINLMRSNPANYVQYVQEYVQYQRDNNGFPQNQATIDELIQDLRNSSKLSILEPMECVYSAASKHGQDLLSMGKTDHVGSDGSWPWDRVLRECPNLTDGNENLVGGPSTVRESVIILLIDEGIPNRGHRKTLMRADWKYVACYKIGQVGQMPNCWVQKFGY